MGSKLLEPGSLYPVLDRNPTSARVVTFIDIARARTHFLADAARSRRVERTHIAGVAGAPRLDGLRPAFLERRVIAKA